MSLSQPTERPIIGTISALAASLLQGIEGSAEPITPTSPWTDAPLARIPQSTADDVRAAFDRAREAQITWAGWPAADRARVALTAHGMMTSRQEELLDIIQQETGKSRLHAYEEFLDGAGSTLYYARKAPGLLRSRRRGGAVPVFTQTREVHHPIGVVATISPWNYPFALSMDVIPALLAGNAVVHKPDNQTVLSSIWARALMIEAGMPPEAWQVVLGDPAVVGDTLIDEADFVGFTGSTPAGIRIGERAASSLTPCSLELGGKNPMLVLEDADLKLTARTAARACFANAGQLCVSIERIYVHEKVYEDFVTAFAEVVNGLTLGTAMDFSVDVGSLTSQRQLDRVQEHVAQAVAAGGRIVAGGKPRPDLGPYFHEPTVLVDVPQDAAVRTEETFGPVVTISSFATEQEAVSKANDTEYGLNASVFSRDVSRARTVGAAIHAGTININEGYASAYASHDAPMGGRKKSGIGRRHGAGGLLKYTDAQTLASQHLVGFDPSFGMNNAAHVAFFNTTLRALKALRVR